MNNHKDKNQEVTILLDGNVLIALIFPEHTHHKISKSWFAKNCTFFATCPVTQGTLLRYVLRSEKNQSWNRSLDVLSVFTEHPKHKFWSDKLSYSNIKDSKVFGHRQVTDLYLLELAKEYNGKLATLDVGISDFYRSDDVILIK